MAPLAAASLRRYRHLGAAASYSIFSPKLVHGDATVLKVQHRLQTTDAKDTSLSRFAVQAGLEVTAEKEDVAAAVSQLFIESVG